MTNFKQTPRNITLQHISLAEAATRQNKEVERPGSSRRSGASRVDHSEADDQTTSTYEERDLSTGSGPTIPLIDSTERVDADSFTSSERREERGRQDSGSSDSESGFSISSSDQAEAEVRRRDPQISHVPTRAINGVGYEETRLGQLDVPMKRPQNVEWVADELMRIKSAYQSGVKLLVLAKRINEGSGRVFKVEGMKDHEHVVSWAGEFKFAMYNLVVKEMNIIPPFTSFQHTALARLDISPSQLHPNGWAFLRAFELVCIHICRPILVELFFHLFELNRNNSKVGNMGRLHLTLRAKQGCKCFRAFKD